MTRRRKASLSRAAADCLEAVHALGDREISTRAIAALLARPVSTLTRNLETLERAGHLTSCLSLDGLERLWSTDGKQVAPAPAAVQEAPL